MRTLIILPSIFLLSLSFKFGPCKIRSSFIRYCQSDLLLEDEPNYSPNSIQSNLRKHLSKSVSHLFTLSTIIPLSAQAISKESLKSDELQVSIDTEFLGLALKEVKYKSDENLNLVVVQSIKPEADLLLKQVIKPGMCHCVSRVRSKY